MKWLALLLAGAGYAGGCAHAQGLTLSPVMLTAPGDGGATSLTVQSDLPEPKLVQVRVFDWAQNDGGEQMVPAANVRFGPEIFEVQPGKSQTVRFLLPDTDGQGAWRVVVDELPPATDSRNPGTQLSLRLRYVLSMFAGDAGKPSQLQARLDGDAVELRNPGPGWLKMHGLSIAAGDGAAEPLGSGIVYLLPGAHTRIETGATSGSFTSISYGIGQQVYTAVLRPLE